MEDGDKWLQPSRYDLVNQAVVESNPLFVDSSTDGSIWQDPAPSNGETEGVHVHVGHEVQILLQLNFGQERKNLKSSKFNNGNSVQRKKERKIRHLVAMVKVHCYIPVATIFNFAWNVSVRVPDARPSAAFVHSAFVLISRGAGAEDEVLREAEPVEGAMDGGAVAHQSNQEQGKEKPTHPSWSNSDPILSSTENLAQFCKQSNWLQMKKCLYLFK
jgi:hypothetical protein